MTTHKQKLSNVDCWTQLLKTSGEQEISLRFLEFLNLGILHAKLLQSCPILCNPMDCSLPGSCPWGSPGKNTGVGCHALLQRIFPVQGLNPDLLHCRKILYCLSHQGSCATLGKKRAQTCSLTGHLQGWFPAKPHRLSAGSATSQLCGGDK